jgi:hypothetical protein
MWKGAPSARAAFQAAVADLASAFAVAPPPTGHAALRPPKNPIRSCSSETLKRSISVIDNAKGLPQAGQTISIEIVSASKRFFSEPTLQMITVAPQPGLSQIAHNSILRTNCPLPVRRLGVHRSIANANLILLSC